MLTHMKYYLEFHIYGTFHVTLIFNGKKSDGTWGLRHMRSRMRSGAPNQPGGGEERDCKLLCV